MVLTAQRLRARHLSHALQPHKWASIPWVNDSTTAGATALPEAWLRRACGSQSVIRANFTVLQNSVEEDAVMHIPR